MSRAPATTFTLSPDNPSNATIYDASGRALYTVATRRLWSGTTTYVMNVNGSVLASLEERDFLPNRVTIGKKPPVPLRNWLHTSLADLSANANVSVKDALGRKYKWRGYAPGYGGTTSTLELYTKDDNYAEPIARFDRPQQRYEAGTRYAGAGTGAEPATLVLAGRALEIRDTVVISCLFLERARRKNESLEKSSAEALSTLPTLAVTYGWGR
ncbi:hypothetical protein DICSQDRAFT_133398 [Dichomitus squalens LYAD-421 SS1]|uniref:uncharacterized protein n=1 Tax=Dichomitus squalens (strain LYAD-421) TaxID=732165 RepID=UPI0004412814|nr:uncharacterized protein DICSQDRAFT_133398 [Dichomitus squalens LYAD-421 SS1]EJF64669.1 hypothetical protein DICSQDRAFT_133398 [Dichomitus squalens LYAD-421 SS1]